jgi:hypothetical protein
MAMICEWQTLLNEKLTKMGEIVSTVAVIDKAVNETQFFS